MTDEQLAQAASLVVSTQYGSLHMLAAKLDISELEARTILDRLSELGIVGKANGGPRKVLVRQSDISESVSAVLAGRRTLTPAPIDDETRKIAEQIVFGTLHEVDQMPAGLARIAARRLVGLLIGAGWRPST